MYVYSKITFYSKATELYIRSGNFDLIDRMDKTEKSSDMSLSLRSSKEHPLFINRYIKQRSVHTARGSGPRAKLQQSEEASTDWAQWFCGMITFCTQARIQCYKNYNSPSCWPVLCCNTWSSLVMQITWLQKERETHGQTACGMTPERNVTSPAGRITKQEGGGGPSAQPRKLNIIDSFQCVRITNSGFRKYFRIWESLKPTAGIFKPLDITTGEPTQGNGTVIFPHSRWTCNGTNACPSGSQVLFSLKVTNDKDQATSKATVVLFSLDIIHSLLFKLHILETATFRRPVVSIVR